MGWYGSLSHATQLLSQSPSLHAGRGASQLIATRSQRGTAQHDVTQRLVQRWRKLYPTAPPAASKFAAVGSDVLTELPVQLGRGGRSGRPGASSAFSHHVPSHIPTPVSSHFDPLLASASRKLSADSIGSAGAMAMLGLAAHAAGNSDPSVGMWSRGPPIGRMGLERRRGLSDARSTRRAAAAVMERLTD